MHAAQFVAPIVTGVNTGVADAAATCHPQQSLPSIVAVHGEPGAAERFPDVPAIPATAAACASADSEPDVTADVPALEELTGPATGDGPSPENSVTTVWEGLPVL